VVSARLKIQRGLLAGFKISNRSQIPAVMDLGFQSPGVSISLALQVNWFAPSPFDGKAYIKAACVLKFKELSLL